MRKLYIKAIEKYMESKQMKEYLISIADELQKWQIIDLICGARADLKDKYETLKEIADMESDQEKAHRLSAATAANNAKSALDELTLKSGEVFLAMEYGYDRDIQDEKIYGAAPHFSLEPVMKYVNEEYADLDDDEKKDATYWYRLEKYIPGVVDDLDMPYTYTIAPNGEIWFTDNVNFDHLDFISSQNLNLPVPFEIGDIITIDCRPFAPLKHAVIVEIGDNWDCCCVQCAWVTNNGNIRTGALKHASVFDDKSFIEVSSLYRAEVFNGELPENETCLKEISKHVYRDEEKGKALWMYSHEPGKGNGIPFEMIKDYFDKAENGE